MKKYKSKIGLGIVLFIAIVIGIISTIMIIDQVWSGLILNLVVCGFIGHMFLTTYCIIQGDDLIIKSGFIINTTIKIESIKKIAETNNPISSPAASLDRLEISYNKFDSVHISPKEKKEFIDHLLSINDKIEILLKKEKNKH